MASRSSLRPFWTPVIPEERAYALLREVIHTQWPNEGPMVRQFEEKLSALLGAEVICTASGTSALQLAAFAVFRDVEMVTVPDLTFVATLHAVAAAGLVPQIVDGVNSRVDVPVWRSGLPCHGALLEDACCALGAYEEHKKRFLGAKRTIAISFAANKILTTGQGGAIATNDPEVAKLVRSLQRNGFEPGADTSSVPRLIGINARMTDLQAAVGLAQLDDLPARVEHRESLVQWYRDAGVSVTTDADTPPLWLERRRDWSEGGAPEILQRCARAGFAARRFWAPIHRSVAGGEMSDAHFSTACAFYDEVAWLPSGLDLTKRDVEKIARELLR